MSLFYSQSDENLLDDLNNNPDSGQIGISLPQMSESDQNLSTCSHDDFTVPLNFDHKYTIEESGLEQRHLKCLKPSEELNGTIINFYLKWLELKYVGKTGHGLHIMDTFFYSSMINNNEFNNFHKTITKFVPKLDRNILVP